MSISNLVDARGFVMSSSPSFSSEKSSWIYTTSTSFSNISSSKNPIVCDGVVNLLDDVLLPVSTSAVAGKCSSDSVSSSLQLTLSMLLDVYASDQPASDSCEMHPVDLASLSMMIVVSELQPPRA